MSYHIIVYMYIYIYVLLYNIHDPIPTENLIADHFAPQGSSEFRSIPCPRTLPGPSNLPCVFFMGFHGISWHLMSFCCWLPAWWLSWPTHLKKSWTSSWEWMMFPFPIYGKNTCSRTPTSMWFNGHLMGFPWDLMVTSWDWYLMVISRFFFFFVGLYGDWKGFERQTLGHGT